MKELWGKLSGRTKDALRVFLITLVLTPTLIVAAELAGNYYSALEFAFYDFRLERWVSEDEELELPVYLYQIRDSSYNEGFDRERFLKLLKKFNQLGVRKVYLLGDSVLEGFNLKDIEVEGLAEVVGGEGSSLQALPIDKKHDLDSDGRLRRLAWDHPCLELSKAVFNELGLELPRERGERLYLKSLAAEASDSRTSLGRGGTAIEKGEYFANKNLLGSENWTNKVVFIEVGTLEGSERVSVETSADENLTAGQVHLSLVNTLASGWTVVDFGMVGLASLFLFAVAGFCFLCSGRGPTFIAVSTLGFLVGGTFLSFSLLPNGFDLRAVVVLGGIAIASLVVVAFDSWRGRSLLKDFGGAEDAGFEGEESVATILFTNLPPVLLEMEKRHDEDLLAYRREYNEVLSKVAGAFHGKVLDFQGDFQMLGFGLRYDDDIEHAAEAIAAALDIVDGVKSLSTRWRVDPNQLSVHAGICTGVIALGHLGAEQKQDMAAIGDTTNTAARLLGAAKKQGCSVMIADSTFELASSVIRAEKLPSVELKGKEQVVEVLSVSAIDSSWREENLAKNKEQFPAGGTLIRKDARQEVFWLNSVFGFVGLLLAFLVWENDILDEPEVRLFDNVHHAIAQREADPDIFIVGLDDSSAAPEHLGPLPWPRGVYAQVIQNLKSAKYKGLFIDVMFKSAKASDPFGDEDLAAAIEGESRVVVAGALFENERGRLESPRLFPAVDYQHMLESYKIGLIHNLIDEDGVTRGGFLCARETASHNSNEAEKRTLFPSAALALLLKKGDDIELGTGAVRAGGYEFSALFDRELRGSVQVRFGPPATAENQKHGKGAYKVVPIWRLLDQSDPIFQDLEGKYLMMGQTMTRGRASAVDRVNTIVGNLKGVEVHARVLDSLLNDDYFRRVSFSTQLILAALVAVTAFAILTLYREPKLYLKLLVLVGLSIAILYLVSLVFLSLVFEVLMLAMTLVTVSAFVLVGRYLLTTRALARVLPKEVVKELLYHHEVKDRRLTATILLTDIRGYTSLSEGRSAVGMLDVLNEYHKRTVACYERHGGQALTYQGDAQIVVFGVFGNRKNPAADAVNAALELQTICEKLRQEWELKSKENFDVGAGLCTGEVEVGRLGSGRNVQYSVVGETVRRAHKVQSLSEDLDAPVILDEPTLEATEGSVSVDDLGEVTLKGDTGKWRLFRAKARED